MGRENFAILCLDACAWPLTGKKRISDVTGESQAFSSFSQSPGYHGIVLTISTSQQKIRPFCASHWDATQQCCLAPKVSFLVSVKRMS